jgi:uncharacterized protein YuzE
MPVPDDFDWEGFDKLVEMARKRYEQHAKGRRSTAPGAFAALDMIFNHLPNVNPTLAALVFGWIEGAFRRAELPEHEYDTEADAWYVHVTHDDVDHTTEEFVNVDWTRGGKLVGIELLPGRPEAFAASANLEEPPLLNVEQESTARKE